MNNLKNLPHDADKQSRIDEAENFFNRFFAPVKQSAFSYLLTLPDKKTSFFDVSTADNRHRMAQEAIELNDQGQNVFFGVNLQSSKPKYGRGKEENISFQTAIVTDIDTLGGEHTDPNKYPPNFDTAKSFLPFQTSMNNNSSYGLHGFCLFQEPIPVTKETLAQIKSRDQKFIDAIRNRAGVFKGAVDGVGDLTRVLRVPGTRNYKLGVSKDAPICHIVDFNNVRFTPEEIDAKLNALPCTAQPATTTKPATKPARKNSIDYADDNPDYDAFRVQLMLDVIPVADLSGNDWLACISALKNLGFSYAEVDRLNQGGKHYNERMNQARWDSLDDPSFDIETLHGIAKNFGYREADARRQWYDLHPELSDKKSVSAQIQDDNKIRTRDRIKDCPVNLIIPDNFILDNNEITQVVPSKKEGGNPKYICVARTPIIPTKIFREPSKCKFSYQIAILTRGVWRTTEIDGRTLADPRAIINLADCGALILEPKILCRFLNDIISLNPDLNEIKAYSQTGWTDDDFTTFAYPHSDDCIVRRAGFDFDRDLASRGNADQWKDKLIEVLNKGGAIAHMYIGTALAAVLARPLNIINPQAHLHGTSGSGKTALQKFTASIFGNPRKLKRSFAATNKNRQLVSAAFCDLPTFYDELETIQGKKAEEQLSTDIYNFADGKGNQANKRDGSARDTFEFGGSRLTTGERPILKDNDLRGAYKRLIQLPIRGHLFDDSFAADLHFFSESNFGHFGSQWIQFATTHMQDIQKKFQHYATCYDPTLKKFEPTHIKTINAALIAVEFFKVMLDINTTFDEDCVLIRNRRAIIDTLPTLADLDDTERALDALSSYVSSHEKSFTRDETSNETGKPIEIGSWGTVCPGKIFDTGAIAFFPTELKRILEDELHFASADKLINAWILDGTIKADSGRKTQVVRLGKRTYRVYYFNAGKISSSIDSAELHYYEEMGVID